MKSAKQDSMVEALRRNKMQGLDITITLEAPDGAKVLTPDGDQGLLAGDQGNDSPDAEAERRELDLAPNAETIDADARPGQPGHPGQVIPGVPGPTDESDKIRSELGKIGLGRKKQLM